MSALEIETPAPAPVTIELGEGFVRALSILKRAVSTRTYVPILTHVLLEARDGVFTARATDLEVSATYSEATDATDFSMTIDLAALVAATKGAKSLRLTVAGLAPVTLAVGGASRTFYPLPADDYPARQTHNYDHGATITPSDIAEIMRVSAFASSEEARGTVLTSTLLETLENGDLRIVAADGHKMGWSDRPSSIGPVRALLPAGFVRLLAGLKTKESPALRIGATRASVQTSDTLLECKLVDGQYPNYLQVVPSVFDLQVTTDRAALLAAIEGASHVAPGRANLTRLSVLGEGLIRVSASSDISGSFETDVPCAIERTDEGPDGMNIAFKGKSLAGVLKSYKSAEIKLELLKPLTCVRISDPSDISSCAVIMPLRA